jgi:hypothetical protein
MAVAACGLPAVACTTLVGADEVTLDGAPIVAVGDDYRSGPAPATTPLTCSYPQGVSFGIEVGDTLPVHLGWQGYVAGELEPRRLDISELYDCEGSKGIDAILLDTSQFG